MTEAKQEKDYKSLGRDEANALVQAAKDGSEPSLAAVVTMVQDDVYGLCLKMLWSPEDATDASQEILIRIITRLSSFRGEAHFRTWAHRVAVNYLHDYRKSLAEKSSASFEAFGQDLSQGLADPVSLELPEAELKLLTEEVKLGCTQGMLLCLDRDHRLAYTLGEVLEFSSKDGGYILDIRADAFRKRLSRARTDIREFMNGHCSLVNDKNPCRCRLRIKPAIEKGRVDPQQPLHSALPRRASVARTQPASRHQNSVERAVGDLQALDEKVTMLHREPRYAAPKSILEKLKAMVSTGQFPLDS